MNKRELHNSEYIKLPLTLEHHLENFSNHYDSTDRHKILWTTWCHNKRWLTHLLEYTLPSFQTYSKHDASHAEAVIHNMELLLGEERIKQLSATDTFMLLHVAYIHDIGMCITDQDKKDIINSEIFLNAIDIASKSNDSQIKNFANNIMQKINKDYYNNVNLTTHEILQDCLEVSLSISYFLSECRRYNHGKISEERLTKMVLGENNIGIGFSTSEIPVRIFIQIAQCGATHTIWGFDAVLDLEQSNTGYAHDYMHPRFIAVLLQIADALDIDNGRFHSLIHSFYGKMNYTSELHFKKHQSIRQLNICEKNIFISADCDSQDVVRLIRKECNNLEQLLKNVNYYWSEISPNEFSGCMPTMLSPKLLYNGREIPYDLINAKFTLSQEKAFRLIEGTNVYGDTFPYLKEVIQNAIDATKFQVWLDYCGSKPKQEDAFFNDKDDITYLLDVRIRKLLIKYPIEIELNIVAIDPTTNRVIQIENYDDDSIFDKYDFGVSVSVQDHGIGISSNDIKKISNVGISHTAQNKNISKMPKLMRPTGKFGVGLQSIFQVADFFNVNTRTHFGEAFNISFSSGSGTSDGVINTTILSNKDDYPLGTQINFVIPSNKRADRIYCDNVWVWDNPFARGYKSQKKLKNAEELLSQVIHYINGVFGEKLFPVVLVCKNLFSERLCVTFDEDEKINIKILQYTKSKKNNFLDKSFKELDLIHELGWAFQINKVNKSDFKGNLIDDNYYLFDINNAKLYIWSNRYSTFASISGERLLKRTQAKKGQNNDKGVKLFYKGISTRSYFKKENNLMMVDYLDIQDAQTGEILLLNREGFTSEGKKLVENIYNEVLKIAAVAYEDISKELGQHFIQLNKDFKLNDLSFLNLNLEDEKVNEKLFLLCIVSYHAILSIKNNNDVDLNLSLEAPWKLLLTLIDEYCVSNDIEYLKLPIYPINTFDEYVAYPCSLPSILTDVNEYGILSYRHDKNDGWKNVLLCCNINSIINYDQLKIYSNNRNLFDEYTVDDRIKKIMKKQWGKLEKPINVSTKDSMDPEVFSCEIISWLFKNTPTKDLRTYFDPILCKDSENSNIRFNRFSDRFPDGLELDSVSMFYILKKIKIIGEKTKASYFRTTVLKGFECLALELGDEFEDICEIKTGYCQNKLNKTMIIPLSNEFITKITYSHKYFLQTNYQLISNLKSKCKLLFKVVEKWNKEIDSKTVNRAFKQSIKSKITLIDPSVEELDSFVTYIEKNYSKIIEFINENKFDNLTDENEQEFRKKRLIHSRFFDKIAEAYYWINEDGVAKLYLQNTLPSRQEIDTLIKEWCELSETDNLIDFTAKKSIINASNNSYKKLYAKFINTIFDIVEAVTLEEFNLKFTKT